MSEPWLSRRDQIIPDDIVLLARQVLYTFHEVQARARRHQDYSLLQDLEGDPPLEVKVARKYVSTTDENGLYP